jgi:hypothetical protein
MKTVGNSQSGAVFSDCGNYRYRLWRCWAPELPRACFILLNPSTADEINNDPTIERQVRRVRDWYMDGEFFGSVEIVNAFAWRSTDPRALYMRTVEPIGNHNDESIRLAVQSADLVVCGWGIHARKIGRRHYELLELLAPFDDIRITALQLNDDGTPGHPLYLPYDLEPQHWIDGELRGSALDYSLQEVRTQ